MEGPEVLGCGADLKNTFTLTKGAYAIMSQHIGDMENFEALRFYEETLENLKAVYRVNPLAIGHDLHPGYMSTAWAEKQQGVKRVPIQHHHAHIASVMAEYGLAEKVIGVAFDGTGYGSDGNIWGGEFFAGDIMDFRRIAHFSSIPLIGGDASIRSPWKTAISYIKHAAGPETSRLLERLGFMERFGENEVANALVLSEKAEFCPLSSGAGRLFDAVASIINLCHVNTFEAEAPMVLESWIHEATDDDYAADIRLKNTWEIDFSPAIISIMNDYLKGIGTDVISARFHNMVVNTVVRVVSRIHEHYGITKVVLSGGAFQNRYLVSKCSENLKKEGFVVFTHKKVPCNDASISLGQAYIVREKIARGIV
jgi:hydrogenase maturation protein HypF